VRWLELVKELCKLRGWELAIVGGAGAKLSGELVTLGEGVVARRGRCLLVYLWIRG
jgi:hypothetical protein